MSLRKIAASAILTRPKGGGQRPSFKMKKGQDASRLRGRKASWDCSRGASPTIRWSFGWRFSHATIWHRVAMVVAVVVFVADTVIVYREIGKGATALRGLQRWVAELDVSSVG